MCCNKDPEQLNKNKKQHINIWAQYCHKVQSVLPIQRFNQPQTENIWEKNFFFSSEGPKKQNVHLPHTGNYLPGFGTSLEVQWSTPCFQCRGLGFDPWRIPWMEEPGGLQSMGSLRVWIRLSDFTFTFHFHALEKEMATHSSVLAWRIPGTAEPGGLPSMGSHRVGHD